MGDLRDVYQLDIRGNFADEMDRLQIEINESRRAWERLADSFRGRGADLRTADEELEAAALTLAGVTDGAVQAKTELRQLTSAEKALANASNRLVAEQNALNETRIVELQVLDQLQKQADPRIIAARAETAALKRLTAALTEEAAQRIFQEKAAAAGLQVSADGKRLFNAEAIAAERAAKAVQKLAIAEQLRQQNRDEAGNLFAAVPQGPGLSGKTIDAEAKKRTPAQAALAAQQKKFFDEELKQQKTLLGLPDPFVGKQKTLAEVTKEGAKSDGVFNRVSFTFRRLIGIMAAFTVARIVVGGFKDMIVGAIKFNAAIESTRVGLTGLITASAEVRDLQGQRLSLDEQLNRAQNISIQQMDKLRANALTTAASYEQLAEAFTQAVAPGLTAGLTLDQIRKVTTEISQAATGLGVAQNQLSEEIRSLFQGTITPRNTRIATALGINNEDIRRAKELGTLFDFLQGRFAAISATGQRLMNTFTGQLSNAADAFQQLLATTSRPLFEQLKGGLADLQKGIFNVVNEQAIFKPEAVNVFKGLFEGLARGAEGVRRAFQAINIRGLSDSLGLVGEVLGTAATAIAKAFSTFFTIAAPSVTLLKTVFALLTAIVNIGGVLDKVFLGFPSTFVSLAGKLTFFLFTMNKVKAVVLLIGKAFQTVARIMALGQKATLLLVTATTSWGKAVAFVRVNLLKLLLPLLAVAAAFTLITKLLPEQTTEKLFDGIGNAINFLLEGVDKVFDRIVKLPEEAKNATKEGLGILVNQLKELTADLADVSKTLKDELRSFANQGIASDATFGLSSEQEARTRQFFATYHKGIEDAEKALEQQLAIEKQVKELEEKRTKLQKESATLNASNAPIIAAERAAQQQLLSIQTKLNKARKELEASQTTGIPIALPLLSENKALSEKIKKLEQEEATAKTILNIRRESLKLTNDETAVNKDLKTTSEQILSLQEQVNESNRIRVELADKALANAIAEEGIAARRNEKELRRQIPKADLGAEAEKARLAALISFSDRELEAANANIAAQEAELALSELQATHHKDIADQLDKIIIARGVATEEGKAAVVSLELELDRMRKLFNLDEGRLSSLKKIAQLEAERRRQEAEGSIGQGITQGLQKFAAENRGVFKIGENLATGFAEGLSSAVGQSVRAALTSDDVGGAIREIAKNFALDIVTGFVTDATKSALSSLLIEAPIKTATETASGAASGTAAGEAMAIAATPGLAAAGIGSGESMSLTAAPGLIAAGAAAGEAFALAAATAKAATLGIAKGGKIVDGRVRQGFSFGGGVTRRPQRQLGMDARDTIPAMLRKGEWVIRPEAVRLYGDQFLSMLNRGRINPAALRGVAGPSGPPPTPKVSFATGGPVQQIRQSRQQQKPQVVVQFFDEQVMSRALASGPESTLRFARQKRSGYRAALGIT